MKVALIILYDSNLRFLLQHRSDDAPVLPGYWALFGGSIDETETPLEAVRREAREELGVSLNKPPLVHEQRFREGKLTGRIYVFIQNFSADRKSIKLNEGQAMGWYSLYETRGLKMVWRDKKILKIVSQFLKGRKGHGVKRV